ncbi:hypothetical protein SCHPADRAFT_931105 [Schizopora paradoxa]|uniref:F-box domain-containing protein n=1 Tax=Schizopora paradoxa TaxID=27342 RepID=A0A0H2RCK9_9AGAM|nr:hypothetical protein SCHPADRAFT_931105 [Schizopora paradoxa]
MSSRTATNRFFNMTEIILLIATFIDALDAKAISYLSRINRCAYASLIQKRVRIVSCPVENVPSLSVFLERHKELPCRSLEIIGKGDFHSDPRDLKAHSSLVSILKRIGEQQTLETFAYKTLFGSNPRSVCVPSEIWSALRASSTSLRSLNIMLQPCSWASLSAIEFIELKSVQLTFNTPGWPSDCRNNSLSPADISLSGTITTPRFLNSMQHLTNLVLTFNSPRVDAMIMNMENLHFPALIAIDIYTDSNSPVLNQFIENHPGLHRLHLSSAMPFTSSPFQTQHFPELRALRFRVESADHWNANVPEFALPDLGNAETLHAHCTYIEHLSIYDLRTLPSVHKYAHPYLNQLRRLDLQTVDSRQVSQDVLNTTLGSFTALIEISITISRFRECPAFGRRAIENPIAELQSYLTSLKDCVPLRAMHLYNPSSQPLNASDLQNLHPVPPSLRYVSWGNHFGTTTVRIVHNSASQSAHAEVCEIPSPPREIVYDWTSKNTFRHLINL